MSILREDGSNTGLNSWDLPPWRGIADKNRARATAREGVIMPKITFDDCLAEIDNALNYWYPLRSDGADQTELDARHVRLFEFRDRLKKQQGEDQTKN